MSRLPPSEEQVARALAEYRELAGGRVRPLSGGLINATFAVDSEAGEFVLQRVHPVFAPEIHHNIQAVTLHLHLRGVTAPRLLKARSGRPWIDLGEAGIWRAMTRLPGVSFATASGVAQARAAGALVGRFHSALADLDYEFQALRQGVHDTPAHLRTLAQALVEHSGHRLFAQVKPLAEQIVAAVAALPPPEPAPLRTCHGDLKFNNILFARTGEKEQLETVALIDLDTVGPMGLHHELGDAWRSWCNRAGEDREDPQFEVEIFAASLEGYREALGFQLEPAERRNLIHGVEWIAVELAARFAADALNERYFGFDSGRFPAAGEHNLQRARGQWLLHLACVGKRAERARLLEG